MAPEQFDLFTSPAADEYAAWINSPPGTMAPLSVREGRGLRRLA